VVSVAGIHQRGGSVLGVSVFDAEKEIKLDEMVKCLADKGITQVYFVGGFYTLEVVSKLEKLIRQ